MQPRTRVKICGITRVQDAICAADLGTDAIGLMLHQPSSRAVDLEQALELRRIIPPFVSVTAVLLDETEDWVAQVLHRLRPDCLQFHGSESPGFCESWGVPYIKAIPMGSVENAADYAARYPLAQGFLLDSNAAGLLGGSGDTFDWSRIPAPFDFPMILAGGINAANVADAITRVKPWAVDVSSGVETAKGIKDCGLIDNFMQQVRRVDGYDGNPDRDSRA